VERSQIEKTCPVVVFSHAPGVVTDLVKQVGFTGRHSTH